MINDNATDPNCGLKHKKALCHVMFAKRNKTKHNFTDVLETLRMMHSTLKSSFDTEHLHSQTVGVKL